MGYQDMLAVMCKTVVSPVLTHRRYICLALKQQNVRLSSTLTISHYGRVGGFWTVPCIYRGKPPLNTVLGKTGFGHPKWEKLGKTHSSLLNVTFY